MKNKNNIIYVLVVFVFSRLLFLFFLKRHSLMLYDSNSYIKIAQYGYVNNHLYAFFPLYPLLIKILHFLILSYRISGMIISNLSILLAVFFLCLIVKKEKTQNSLILLFIISPILCFNTICYTEGLYLLLTILSFYFYKKNKVLSGVFVGLSMLTRNTGIVLLGAYTLELLYRWYKKKIKFKEILLFVIPALTIGLLYSLYLWIVVKNPFMYITVQSTEWERESCNIFTLFIKDIEFIFNNSKTIIYTVFTIYIALINWLFVFLAIYHSFKNTKKDSFLSIYVLVSIILFTLTCRTEYWNTLPSIGLFRYVFSLFPMYLFLVDTKEDKKIYMINMFIYIVISIVNAYLFYGGNFIA